MHNVFILQIYTVDTTDRLILTVNMSITDFTEKQERLIRFLKLLIISCIIRYHPEFFGTSTIRIKVTQNTQTQETRLQLRLVYLLYCQARKALALLCQAQIRHKLFAKVVSRQQKSPLARNS